MNNSPTKKTSQLMLRTSPAQKQIIQLAAEIEEKSISAFTIESAYHAAKKTLLEQGLIMATNETFENFSKLLDRLPGDNKGLKKLFSKPSPWDE